MRDSWKEENRGLIVTLVPFLDYLGLPSLNVPFYFHLQESRIQSDQRIHSSRGEKQ